MTELMLLLVFMTIAFSFLAKKEGLLEVPHIQLLLNEQRKENARLRTENGKLSEKLAKSEAELGRLQRFLDRINIDSASLKPKGDAIYIDSSHTYVLSHNAGQAPGHPQCALKSRYLLDLALLPGGTISGQAAWDTATDASAVNKLPGITVLASNRPLSVEEFTAVAKPLFTQNLTNQNCVFVVSATRKTKDADEFDAELRAVERFFNVSRH